MRLRLDPPTTTTTTPLIIATTTDTNNSTNSTTITTAGMLRFYAAWVDHQPCETYNATLETITITEAPHECRVRLAFGVWRLEWMR